MVRCQIQNSNGKEHLGKGKVAEKQIEYGSEEKNRIKSRPTIWCVALLAAETWTLAETSRKNLYAFERRVWRRMLKISWTEKMPN